MTGSSAPDEAARSAGAVTLAPLRRSQTGEVLHLALGEGQERFVGHIAALVLDSRETIDFHMIREGSEPVGFFKIDRDFARDGGYVEPQDWGLRGFLVGAQYQGRGVGRSALAALPGYLRTIYPGLSRLYLTVNCANAPAIGVYRASGWQDTGGIWEGGRSGPQHIYRLVL